MIYLALKPLLHAVTHNLYRLLCKQTTTLRFKVVVGVGQQENLDLDFVLFDTHQQIVTVILR